MAFIDSSYFVGEINIPNSTQAPTLTALTQAIGQYEKEILISLLGYKLYSLLIAASPLGVPSGVYVDLVNGAEFTHSFNGEDITLKWEGLKNASLQSLIAYYTFYKYVERDVTRLYGTGVSMASTEKGFERVSPVNKLCNAWERMRELYGKIPPEYKQFYSVPIKGANMSGAFNSDPSAYNFLLANKTDYPDWIFTPQWNINSFGI